MKVQYGTWAFILQRTDVRGHAWLSITLTVKIILGPLSKDTVSHTQYVP